MPGSHISLDVTHLGEEAGREQYRVAPLSAARGDTDRRARSGVERFAKPREVLGAHSGHVGKTDDRALGLRREGGHSARERGAETRPVVGVVREGDIEAGERRFHLRALVTGHHHHRAPAGRRCRGAHRAPHHRLTVHRLEQLVALAHAPRLAGREDDDRDLARGERQRDGRRIRRGAAGRGPAELLLEEPARSPPRELLS